MWKGLGKAVRQDHEIQPTTSKGGQAVPFTTSTESSVGGALSFFIAINTNDNRSPKTNTADGFMGAYSGGGFTAGFKPILGDINIAGQYSISDDGAWRVWGYL